MAWAWIRRNRWFMLVVVLPVLLTTLYYGLIASDQYVSQSRFVIKSATQRNGQISTLANLVQTTSLSSGQEQTSEIMDYIRSRDALANLSKEADLSRIYGASDIDRLSRYPQLLHRNAFENMYKYYQDHILTRFDNDTSLAILETRAFTPGDAHALNEMLLGLSEKMVNRLNRRAQQRGIAEAEQRVSEAEQRVRSARTRLAQYRNEHDLLDPDQAGHRCARYRQQADIRKARPAGAARLDGAQRAAKSQHPRVALADQRHLQRDCRPERPGDGIAVGDIEQDIGL